MKVIDLDERSPHGWPVRARVLVDPGMAALRAAVLGLPSGLRAVIGADDRLHAWDATSASHVDVARAMGLDGGRYDSLRIVAEGRDVLRECPEWEPGDGDRSVGGVRVLPGLTPWDRAPLRALGFGDAPPAGNTVGREAATVGGTADT